VVRWSTCKASLFAERGMFFEFFGGKLGLGVRAFDSDGGGSTFLHRFLGLLNLRKIRLGAVNKRAQTARRNLPVNLCKPIAKQ
jgi:hypothetical protein